MAENSKIQWTNHTFNPWSGCQKVSPGCHFCYAENDYSVKIRGVKWGPKGNRIVKAESGWKEPVKWDRAAAKAGERRRVFCASLADVFEDWQGNMVDSDEDRLWISREILPITPWQKEAPQGSFASMRPLTMSDVRARLFRLIDATPNLDWLLLTKRPESIARMMPPNTRDYVDREGHTSKVLYPGGVRPNVWLGASVEDQQRADERIPHLLKVPAAVRFLSIEPLLGPVDLSEWMYTLKVEHNGDGDTQEVPCRPDIHWAIIGGESGHGARPCNVAWIRDIISQCKAASVTVFVKQLGKSYFSGDNNHSHIFPRDSHGGDPEEWPEDLRVREMPVGTMEAKR